MNQVKALDNKLMKSIIILIFSLFTVILSCQRKDEKINNHKWYNGGGEKYSMRAAFERDGKQRIS